MTTYTSPYAMAIIHRHLSSLFEAEVVVLVHARGIPKCETAPAAPRKALFTKFLPLMADDPLVIYGLRHGERPHA